MNSDPLRPAKPAQTLWPLSILLLLGGMVFLIVVLAGILLVLPFFNAEKNVTVIVNGQATATRTGAGSVAALLSDLKIPVHEGDSVSPTLTSPITDNLTVQITRARSVTLTIDGQSQVYRTQLANPAAILESLGVMVGRSDQLVVDGSPADPARLADWPVPVTQISLRRTLPVEVVDGSQTIQLQTTSQTVGEALFDAGITLYVADEVMPDLNAPVSAGMQVVIERAQPLYIIADGTTVETRARGSVVADALVEAGIALVGQDYTIPDEQTPLLPGMRIRVIRVTDEIVTEEETQPFETVMQADANLELDQRQEIQIGQERVVRTSIRVRYENGIEISREPVESVVVQEGRDRVIAYGTNVVLRTVDTPQGPRQYWRRVRMWATSYHPAALGGDNTTATGDTLRKGIVASRPDVIDYGSEVFVPGYGIGKMADTGPIYRPMFIDLGYSDHDYQPWARWVDVYLLAPAPDDIRYLLPE